MTKVRLSLYKIERIVEAGRQLSNRILKPLPEQLNQAFIH
jgi:hypothetical protein